MVRKLVVMVMLLWASVALVPAAFSQTATISDFAWNSDGTKLVVGHNDGTVEILSRQRQSLAVYSAFETSQPITSVAWNPRDATQLAVGGYYGSAKVLDVSHNPPTTKVELASQVDSISQIAFSSDGQKIAVAGSTDIGPMETSSVTVWDAVGRGDLLAADHRNISDYQINQIAWDPVDSNLLAITGASEYSGPEIRLWDVQHNKVLWQIQEPDSLPLSLAWSPDGQQLAFAGVNALLQGQNDPDNAIRVHIIADTASGVMSPSLYLGDIGNGIKLAWSPNLYLATDSLKLQIWDMRDQHLVTTSDVYCDTLAWSPAGDLACLTNRTVQIISGLGSAATTPMPHS